MNKLKNNSHEGSLCNKLVGLLFAYSVLTAFTGFLLVSVWFKFVSNPTVTSLESTGHPVSAVPFPGVSLCNLNKISRKRAQKLAHYISSATGESKEKIMEAITFLGYLYNADYHSDIKNTTERFQIVLDSLDLKIRTVMRQLATPCEEMLKKCQWNGVVVNCSTIFDLRLTYEGYCCTFNYVKNTSEIMNRDILTLEPLRGSPSLKYGLSVIVNNDLDDYFFTAFPSTGINVHIFVPTDYPDKTSGSLMDGIAGVGSENFFEVIPTTVRAVKDVMNYAVDKRNCLFEVEQLTQFGVYSQSDCFVDCRTKSMLILCQCIPFTIPYGDDSNVCNLLDLPCLNKYHCIIAFTFAKFSSLIPQNMDDFIVKEHEEGLSCSTTCFPACEGTLYEMVTSNAPLFDKHSNNITSIHIYYRDKFHDLFYQDVVHYWFDILSSYGGVVGLVMGLSFISVVEGIVFSIKYVIAKW